MNKERNYGKKWNRKKEYLSKKLLEKAQEQETAGTSCCSKLKNKELREEVAGASSGTKN